MKSSYARTLPDGRQSTKNDAGPPRVRLRFSSATATIQMSIEVDIDARGRFYRFWNEDTARGSLPFLMTDWPIDGQTIANEDGDTLTTEDGDALILEAALLLMFGTDQPPSETPVGANWRIVFPLTIMP